MDLNRFQAEVNYWQAATFPESTVESVLKHLRREVRELSRTKRSVEAADVFLLLLAFCGKRGLSLAKLARTKLAINRKRKWGKPDRYGVREHVRGRR